MASSAHASDPRPFRHTPQNPSRRGWIGPVKPIANWADRAPGIAGLPGFTEEALRVLQQGTGPEGEVLRPPMHIYHMNQEDAKAIVAYLKSLQPPVH
jgi:hypothetical protein